MKIIFIQNQKKRHRRLLCFVVVIVILFINNEWLVSLSQAAHLYTNDAEVVKQFYPQSLRDKSESEFNSGGLEPSEFSDFALADLNKAGKKDFIIAAYTNGFSGAIRVLRKIGDGVDLVNEPNLPLMGGIIPKVQVINLDTDPQPEVIASFSSARGPSANWVFKWDGNELNLIGPTVTDEHGDISTVLSEADFIDLNGDGVKEMINPPQLGSALTFQVYGLNGRLVKTLNFLGTFIRNKGNPAEITRTFTIEKVDVPYQLTVISGDGTKDNGVSSATITLDGGKVAGPEIFNKNKRGFMIPIALTGSNTHNIKIQLQSSPGGQLTLFIEPAP